MTVGVKSKYTYPEQIQDKFAVWKLQNYVQQVQVKSKIREKIYKTINSLNKQKRNSLQKISRNE